MVHYAGQHLPATLVDLRVAIFVSHRMVVINEVRGRLLRIIGQVLLGLLILPVLGQQCLIMSHTLHALSAHLGLLIAFRKLVSDQVAVRHLINHGTARIARENGANLLHGAGWNK